MRLYSTNNISRFVSLEEAVMKGLPDDRGLYMPAVIPTLPELFFKNLSSYTFPELSFEISKTLLQDAVPHEILRDIIFESIDFPAPLVALDDQTHILELFHGPSLAFKDFGARFMARLMGYFNRNAEKELVILVATSGDTGGAVAAGFYKTSGIKVVILYPSGKVSFLQEQQLTTLGHNVFAIEVEGTFDDCQALVKQAFVDKEVNDQIRLSSANSINIARLIPQMFYYFEAYKQLNDYNSPLVFSVPSGNFGNLTAGLLAKRMGLPVSRFIAATNLNDIVPAYLETGIYNPRPSVQTLSNAMDVGNPSNYSRMADLYGSTWNNLREDIKGYAFSNEQTAAAMREVNNTYSYILDPHGAVGFLAWRSYQQEYSGATGIVLETAHPAKFLPDVERILEKSIPIPDRLSQIKNLPKNAIYLKNDYLLFKEYLLQVSR